MVQASSQSSIVKEFKEIQRFEIKDLHFSNDVCLKEYSVDMFMSVFNTRYVLWNVNTAQIIKDTVINIPIYKFLIHNPNTLLCQYESHDSGEENLLSLLAAVDLNTGDLIKYFDDIRTNKTDYIVNALHLEGSQVLAYTRLGQMSILNINIYSAGRSVVEAATLSSPLERRVSSVAVSGVDMLVGYETGRVKVWSSVTREDLVTFEAHNKNNLVSGIVVFSPMFCTFSEKESIVKVWNSHSYNHKFTLTGLKNPVTQVYIVPDTNHLFAMNREEMILFDCAKKTKLKEFEEYSAFLCSFGSGKYLVKKSRDYYFVPFLYDFSQNTEKELQLEGQEKFDRVLKLGDSTVLISEFDTHTKYTVDLTTLEMKQLFRSYEEFNCTYSKVIKEDLVLVIDRDSIIIVGAA
eukprot:CAMPEP_0170524158 /NCGR_PEP_ID=MMETSP0209-20121228/9575_1 /TAXON_ID=665100 ORGANISM="Litonotus pictus, Strain P1" /NCGR_SAMPLE_ID=MMETSP0209 /ASSEMBLY_ACC=CAM_ASM_000301 /LENGTH=404 /DNA_ID=CAMNT_0010812663 /DNA_START=169 /DNA_END=1380 /DNA_ORIENTATION=+